MSHLSPRQQSILNRVVDAHIETGLPVGSRFITELYTEIYRSSYSPATVRHEMVTLEELGYLTHPHTSAGRIPTDRGYRYYVDHSLQEEKLAPSLKISIADDLMRNGSEPEALAEKACEILSELSKEAGLILIHNEQSHPQKMKLKIFIKGSSCFFEKPEFQDRNTIHGLFKALEDKTELAQWLTHLNGKGVTIRIGQENKPPAFQSCSVVATSFSTPRGQRGTVALVGPRRMKYGKAVPLVSHISRVVTEMVERAEEN